jgi:secretion/DNA translocation related TadE-like protein
VCQGFNAGAAILVWRQGISARANFLRERPGPTMTRSRRRRILADKELLLESDGSGTVLGFALLVTGFAVSIAVLSMGNLILANQKLQDYADEIALSAEDALRGISFGYPCEVAQAMSDRFGILLDTCRILNSETWIVVKQSTMGILLSAKAHATT